MKEFMFENPIIVLIAAVLMVAIIVFAIRNGYRAEMAAAVYNAVCYAEQTIVGTKKGQERKSYVIRKMHDALPAPLRLIITEKLIGDMIECAVSQMKETLKIIAGDKLVEAEAGGAGNESVQ